MATHFFRPWGLYLMTFFAALAAAGSATFWVLGTLAAAQPVALKVALVSDPALLDTQSMARALGASLVDAVKTVPAPRTRYQLLGVVAGPVGKGYALLVVGGAPPKAYTVGASLGDGWVLQSVSARGAKIGTSVPGEATVELSLPKPTGT